MRLKSSMKDTQNFSDNENMRHAYSMWLKHFQEYMDKYEQNVDILDDDTLQVDKSRLEGLKAFKKQLENTRGKSM